MCLRQEQDNYDFCQKQIAECDQQLQQYLRQREDRSEGSICGRKAKGAIEEIKEMHPPFDLRAELFRMTGTDLTQIDGIDVMMAMTILSETGSDMSKWKTEHHFVSWLQLCPDNKISGDKVIGKGRLPTKNRVTSALRMAASAFTTEQYISGSAIPPTEKQARASNCD